MSSSPCAADRPRGAVLRLRLLTACLLLAVVAFPGGAGAAAARPPAHARKLPSAAAARALHGRAGRCARAGLRLHLTYRQYRLCLKDGKIRRSHPVPPVVKPGPPSTTPAGPPASGTPTPPAPETKLTAAIYGDAPYGTAPSDTSQFDATPSFIDAVNADPKVQMVAQVGDIHSGKQYCTASYDQSIFDLWTRFADPLVYTPGDNEWADCHKPGEGGGTYNSSTGRIDYATDSSGNPVDYANGDPVANLTLVRQKFFPQAGTTLGAQPMSVMSQAQVIAPGHPRDRDYVENVMFERAGVLFVTVNLPGGSNNDTDPWYGAATQSAQQQQEVADRSGADLRWISAAFAKANSDDVKGVVVSWQADVWDLDGKPSTHLSQYDQFVNALADGTTSFGKPVLMFNGDSHVYKSDNPLSATDPANAQHPGHDVPNFHRVVVHGSTAPLEYLRLAIDTTQTNPTGSTSFGPFSWERVIP